MEKNEYEIRYLPSFYEELNEIIYHITYKLRNKIAAERLYMNIINAINERSKNPEFFEVYKNEKSKKYKWFRIYIDNYTIFYIVRNNIIEISRIIYNKRNLEKLL